MQETKHVFDRTETAGPGLDAEIAMLERMWFPVARSEDLRSGELMPSVLLGRKVLLHRGESRLMAAEDVCPHRGAELSLGEVLDGTLQCPYHGWRFRVPDGQCVRVPALPAEEDTPHSKLAMFSVREQYGHIWVSLQDPFLELPQIPEYDEEGWVFRYGVPHDLACGIRSLTENFRDMAHFPFVHRESMGPNVRREVDPYDVARDGWSMHWTLSTDLGGTAFDGNEALATKQTLTYNVALASIAFIRTDFPDGGARLVLQFASPLDRSLERCRQFYAVGINAVAASHPGASIDDMFAYEKQIFEEDWPIVQSQYPRETPLDPRLQAHTRADRFSVLYRRMYLECIKGLAAELSRTT